MERRSYGLQHVATAHVALHDRGAGHADDGAMLAAIGADRAQLEAVQTVDAAVAAGERRRPQPGLAAVWTGGTEVDRLAHPAQPTSPAGARDEEPVGGVAMRPGAGHLVAGEELLGRVQGADAVDEPAAGGHAAPRGL